MLASRFMLISTLLLAGIVRNALAGGSGLNVVVLVNQNSTNSVQLANAYCEQRTVPPQNVLFLTNTWSGGNLSCSLDEFQNGLLAPLLGMIQNRKLTNQIQYVLLSMDIPYQVIGPNGLNSTTSALFYGFKPDVASQGSCSLPDVSSNSYAYSELAFPNAPPNTASTNSFLAVMLTDNSLSGAKSILSRGVASDSTFPTQTVYLEKTGDYARNIRYTAFDNAVFDTLIEGGYSMIRDNTGSTGYTNMLGMQTGLSNLTLDPNAFAPGAIGDSLTSFGGILFTPTGQTSLLAFLEAGAAGSYGTVVEPCNYVEKFPNSLVYFYQARGFSLAEAYYQSIENPHQGLIVGEPLSAPFARPGQAFWNQPATNPIVLTGLTNLAVQFNAATTNRPLTQVDLFIDGTWFETVTNLQPASGDHLSITINGTRINYTVPASSTIVSVATGLVAAINSASNTTAVAASLSGQRLKEVEREDAGYSPMYVTAGTASDRIELHSLNPSASAATLTLDVGPVTNTTVPTTFLVPARSNFLDSIASGYRYFFVTNSPLVGDWLQLMVIKTNGTHVTVGFTNTVAGITPNQMVANLLAAVAGNIQLQSADGVYANMADGFDNPPAADFFVFSQSPGWPASQIQAALKSSSNLKVMPATTNLLQDNLPDLQPRTFIYIASGALSIPATYRLDTTRLTDGYHELTFVAYEGTSVRTQTRLSQNVQVQNSMLQASFTALNGGTNTDLNSTLLFSIIANTNNIASIALFGTGGLLTNVVNQSNAMLSIPAAGLGLGLHPFYAIVTANDGKQYRTQTIWIRLIGLEPSFSIFAISPPTKISWMATAGRSYDILATTNLLSPFQTIATFTPSNSAAVWNDTNASSPRQFYRVRTVN